MEKKNSILFMIMFFVFGITITVNAASCEAVFGSKLIDEVRNVFKIIQYAAPIILVLLTSIDFAKVVFGDSKDGLNKAKDNFLKRAVAVFIIFFAPYIIILIMKLIDDFRIGDAQACVNQF